MAYSPNAQSRYNQKMYYATAKLNPDSADDAALIEKIEKRTKDKNLSRQAAIKEMLKEAQ